MRILTGLQPSGQLHIGNYFGAIKPAIDAQGEGGSALTIPAVPWLMGLTLYGTAVTVDPVNFPLFRTSFPSAVPITIQ